MSTISRRFGQQQVQTQTAEWTSTTAPGAEIWQSIWLPPGRCAGQEESLVRHCQRVGMAAQRLAERMGFDAAFRRQAYLGGLLHDIGKVTIPDAVLRKPSTLNKEEVRLLREHPASGARMVLRVEAMRDVIPAILSHHERIDGKGYPRGIGGRELCNLARIVAVADCFDAMTSQRTYRPARPVERVREEMKRIAGKHLDGEMVGALLGMDLEALREELSAAMIITG